MMAAANNINNNINTHLRFASLFMLLVSQVIAVDPLSLHSRILQDSIIKRVNEDPNAGWKAAINPTLSNYTGVPVVTHDKSLKLPAQFDARAAWPQCTTIGKILDQGHCGSCWAFGAVESLSDRFCIHFGMNMSLSVNDLLACCGFLCGSGCNGGYSISAWRYFVYRGVVTNECDPYFDDTGCTHPGCEPGYPTPKCTRKCVNGNQLWKESKHFSVGAYRVKSDPHDIMAEVYKNGPVEVSYTVYEDFAHYKSGVYRHVTGSALGGHAVKLIGWGTSEEGDDYWLIANQWNTGWGDDGYFKILRGTNECGIEHGVVAGLPSAKNLIREVTDVGGFEDAMA